MDATTPESCQQLSGVSVQSFREPTRLSSGEPGRGLVHAPHRGVAAGGEDEGSVGGQIDVDGQVAVGAFVIAPLWKVAVEEGFGCFFEEVAEAVFAVGLPLLEQVEAEDELALGSGGRGLPPR